MANVVHCSLFKNSEYWKQPRCTRVYRIYSRQNIMQSCFIIKDKLLLYVDIYTHTYIRHTALLLHFALLCSSQILRFLQIENKTLHQQKDSDSLYCNPHFIEGVWKQTCSISKVCLYIYMYIRIHTNAHAHVFGDGGAGQMVSLRSTLTPFPITKTRFFPLLPQAAAGNLM